MNTKITLLAVLVAAFSAVAISVAPDHIYAAPGDEDPLTAVLGNCSEGSEFHVRYLFEINEGLPPVHKLYGCAPDGIWTHIKPGIPGEPDFQGTADLCLDISSTCAQIGQQPYRGYHECKEALKWIDIEEVRCRKWMIKTDPEGLCAAASAPQPPTYWEYCGWPQQ